MAADSKTASSTPAMSPTMTTFITPQKRILAPPDVTKWEKSSAYSDLLSFIHVLNESVKGKKLRDPAPHSDTIKRLETLLTKLSDQVDATPPIEQPQRFGNKAFRSWYEWLAGAAEEHLKEALQNKFHPAIVELKIYLTEAFGNSTRIDYGTGHELNFVIFLCCLFKLGALLETDAPSSVLNVFNSYITLCRKLQTTYRMEPAGSHGVWSLDDFQFVPFIWGSGQLINHPRLKPSHFVEPDYYESFYKDFMFLACIKYIASVKTGPFAEHSNTLWGISGVANWDKVNSGLVKMYKAEVLAKFPVVQHCLFGNLFSIEPAKASQ